MIPPVDAIVCKFTSHCRVAKYILYVMYKVHSVQSTFCTFCTFAVIPGGTTPMKFSVMRLIVGILSALPLPLNNIIQYNTVQCVL